MKFFPIRKESTPITRRKQRGQGLVEFALILSLLLLLMMGIFDFGRALIIYTNLFNAAREGARYGAVHPWEPGTVEARVRQSIILVAPNTVNITVCCDRGPGTSTFYCDLNAGSVSGSCGGGTGTGIDGKAGLGDRIVVRAQHSLGLITPLVTAFAQTLPIDTTAARTIATYGEAVGPPGPGTGGGGGAGGGGVTVTPGGPTATPSTPFITLSPTCSAGGSIQITVNGYNWQYQNKNDDIRISWDGTQVATYLATNLPPTWSTTITVNATNGSHTVTASNRQSGSHSATYVVPCAAATNTPTPGPTATPTAPPIRPIVINKPLCIGATTVSGTGTPGQNVYLRNVSTGYGSGSSISTIVQQNNVFTFSGVPALALGDLIVVQGYGYTDYAIVIDCTVTPTRTPTPPGPTPTPTGPYIVLSPNCSNGGNNTQITVYGYNWGSNQRMALRWDGALIGGHDDFRANSSGAFQRLILVNATLGRHTVRAEVVPKGTPNASAIYDVPCSLTGPNIVVTSLTLLTTPPLQTYQPLRFRVNVANTGNETVNTLFWVDLFADTTSFTSTPSVAWSAIGSLNAGATRVLTMEIPGFSTTGVHNIIAFADSFNQVAETNENDNTYGPLQVTIASEGPTPTPTATPQAQTGSIVGITFLLRNMNVTPLGRAMVYCYQGATLIASTVSNEDGSYQIVNIPPATDYTLVAEALVDGLLYRDEVYPVGVTAGWTTNQPLFLHR